MDKKKILHASLKTNNTDELCTFCHDTATDALSQLGMEGAMRLAHAVLFTYFSHGVLASIPGAEVNATAKQNIKFLSELLDCAGVELQSTFHTTKTTKQD